ncbi:WD40 repeat-like protein [Fomitiporia mediterranea MF3/22]|uniref:WD40 repeat-like protein n=1 Tax=Fomitiporia mediterranea (strain MF3/22) TaxID=694068 RepID=UPI00044094BC|nr:WD40 repeat-like protein [Fomitiporia mediterranea MF3/22]EJD04815.1 WD40 repeat-like protein [Fomitiporia mediterranea MF3/22]
MASTSTATNLALTVIRASDVKWQSTFRSKLPNLYVEIEFNNNRRRTPTIKETIAPEWNKQFSITHLSTGQGTELQFRLKHDSSRWGDKCLGKVDVELDDLLDRCADGKDVDLRLDVPCGSVSTEIIAVLHLRLEFVDSMAGGSLNIDAAEHAIQQSGISTSAAASESGPVTAANATIDHFAGHADLYKSVGALISKLDVFVRAMDTLSQIHPYANFAWQLVSALYKTVKQQFEVDKKVVELVHAMRDAFDFVEQASSLREKTKRFKTTILQLLKQTNECSLFIQEYARHKFARRMTRLNTDTTVDGYIKALEALRTSINSETIMNIAFVSSRISSKVDALFLKGRLNPDEASTFDRPQCLPGTRETILHEIVEWVASGSDQNVLWLYGVAGCGKSTVSATIAELFRVISRLGAHLFFQRGKSEPSSVIRTLAYKLASFDSSIANHVIEAIEEDSDIAQASGTVQFEKLINVPLVHAREAMPGPVVIVLDALDECGTEKSRQGLLELFREGLGILPKNFRFLITSRKEMDIDRVLNSQPECIRAVELEHDSTTCKDDVRWYIDHEMRKVFTKNLLTITDDWEWKMDRLGDAAGGLFVWASTGVKLVDCVDPAEKLKELTVKSKSLSGLDQLYGSVLKGSNIPFGDEVSKIRFSQILGLILLGKVPLSDTTIDKLLEYSDDRPSRLILSRLQSVFVYSPGAPIRFCHTSFRDYLITPGHERDPWFIDVECQQKMLASRCFDVMRDMLRFNICDIQSSYIPNEKIPDLPDRVKANIPPHLQYACLFWSQHLCEARFSHTLLGKLSELLDEHLLYWLEVMTLLKQVNVTGPAFHRAMNWVSSHDANILSFLRDARRMVTRLSLPISQSTPHIYVSALLFASRESKFIARYLKPDLSIVQVEQMGKKQQSPLLKELTGNGGILSVALPADGTRVASGSWDNTVQIWDAESGRVIFGPFEGHEEDVHSVAFSPDGVRVVSGSRDKSIRIWDVESGQMIHGPMKGHDDEVLSVAFSPDGKRVASGSADKTVMVWYVESGQAIKRFKGHEDTVRSVAFSPDGTRVASGSADDTIRIWDIESGQTVCSALEGHSSIVTSVAFSHDGTRIVSGSWDYTFRIWDAESGDCISKPFEGHTQSVTSVAFSPDGKRVVSGSHDKTVRIWDVESGQVVSGPFTGHSHYVSSVAFSPDGTRVVSGSWDSTIRIWDAESVQAVSGDFEGHIDGVNSVAFSPNGKRVVSGSADSTIRIWDAESGRMVFGPFEGHSWGVSSVAFSPDGRRVASGSGDQTIRLWDAESGNVVSGPFEGHEDWVTSVCFLPDGSRVVSGSYDKTLRIWDVESGKAIPGPFEGHTDHVYSIAVSPDGRRVVSGSKDKTIIVWDVESGEIISGPLKGHTDEVRSVAFSPDGTCVASGSGDGTILIWNVENGQVVSGPFEGHTGCVWSVAFSPDGSRVVSGSFDSIRVWDTESGQAVFAPFESHTLAVLFIAFSPDGRRIVSGSFDCAIRMWNVEDPIFDWTMDVDGWIHGRNGELLVWIPLDLWTALWRPQNTAVFNCAMKLDFSNAALGERWQECFEAPQ